MKDQAASTTLSELSSFSLTVEWWDGASRSEFGLNDIDEVARIVREENALPVGFSSDCDDFVRLLEVLAPLIDPDFDEGTVNGIPVVVAEHCEGGYWLVPTVHHSSVEVLHSRSAHWLSVGPCSFDQSESILRIGDLYWVDTSGDTEQQRIVVGRFSDPTAGLAAAVERAVFFTLDDSGSVVCELDGWPQDE